MVEAVAVVFTGESVEKVISEGGTSAWRLDPSRARNCRFVVCARNISSRWPEVNSGWPKPVEPDRSAFLVGAIRDVVSSPEHPNRFVIRFTEFARIAIPDVWKKGSRNPVMYSTLGELGIDDSKLSWESVPQSAIKVLETTRATAAAHPASLTIAEAKAGLARSFGISPDQIEITIKG